MDWVDEDLREPLTSDSDSTGNVGRTGFWEVVSSWYFCGPCDCKFLDKFIEAKSNIMYNSFFMGLWSISVFLAGGFWLLLLVNFVDMGSEESNINYFRQTTDALNILGAIAIFLVGSKRLRELARLFYVKRKVLKGERNSRNVDGHNWKGARSDNPFEHIPWKHRVNILILLNLQSIFMYVNTSAMFRRFRSGDLEGNDELMTKSEILQANSFFYLSFICAFVAMVYVMVMEQRLWKVGDVVNV